MLMQSAPFAAAGPAALSLAPNALSISIVPTRLPADNHTYPAVVVSVIDLHGLPTVALIDIQVSLTSSQENVGKITPKVDIPVGQTYVTANFTTTHNAGSTTLTATTTGLISATATVSTVIAVGYPTHLVIVAVPSTVPARPSNIGSLILEMKDDTGLPAKAISDIPITLYSSNANVANVTAATVTMKQGQYLEEVSYKSGFVPGAAILTASAPGFGSGTATISVLGSPPLALKLIAQPSVMVACAAGITSCAGRLVVALTDLSGNPTLANRDIQVQISSSDLAVVNAFETTTIKAGNISATATFTVAATVVGNLPDVATITASSPGLQSSFAPVTILNSATLTPAACGAAPQTNCLLSIFAGPNPVLADHRSYSSVVVALEENSAQGLAPAVNMTGSTRVTLTSSVTGVGNFTKITFSIPEGQNWAAVTFTSTFQIGQTVLTASGQNFLPAQTGLATYGSVPSNVVVSAISPTLPADASSHPALELALVDALGSPAIAPFNVPIRLSSSRSDVAAVSQAVIPSGASYAIVNVTAGILHGAANITAIESSFTSGYQSSSTVLTAVIPAPSAISVFSPNGGAVLPTSLPNYPLFAIQLEDSGSNPARARTPVNVTITSSNSTVISKQLAALVNVGLDYVMLSLKPAVPGTTTLTFTAPGLSTTTAVVNFLPYPATETITGGPKAIFTNQTAAVSVTLMIDGSPVKDALVQWGTTSGGVIVPPHPSAAASTPTTTTTTTTGRPAPVAQPVPIPKANDTTSASGTSSVVFKPSKAGSAVISASINQPGLPPKTLNMTIAVSAPPPSHVKAKPSLISEFTTFPMILAPVGGAAGAAVLIVLVIKKRGARGSADEDFDESLG